MNIKIDRKFFWQLFKSTFIVSMFTVGGGYVIIPLLKAKYVDGHFKSGGTVGVHRACSTI